MAYAVFGSLNHRGQGCRWYARMCVAMRLLDGWLPAEADLTPNAREIYASLG